MKDYTLKGLVSHLDTCNMKTGEIGDGYHYIDFKKIIRNPEYSAMIYSGEIDDYIEELLKEKPAAHIIINNVITDQKNTIHLEITKDGIRFDIYESNNSVIDDDDINHIAFIDTIYSLEEILGENINGYPDPEFIFEFDSNKTYTLDYVIQSYYRTYPKINKYLKFNNMIKDLKKITSSTELVLMNYEKAKDELFDIFKDFKYKPYYCTTEKELKKYFVDAVNASIKALDKKSLELTQFATNLYN